jgi:predicted transcriptional regulator
MDRLTRKGVVERVKAGRAYVYRARLTAEEARAQAVGQVLENFFGGSKEALVAHLGSGTYAVRRAAAGASSASASTPADAENPEHEPVVPGDRS